MRSIKRMAGAVILLCAAVSGVHANETADRDLPVPRTVSDELQKLIGAKPLYWWNTHPNTAREWKKWVGELAEKTAASIPALREKMGVTVAYFCLKSAMFAIAIAAR